MVKSERGGRKNNHQSIYILIADLILEIDRLRKILDTYGIDYRKRK